MTQVNIDLQTIECDIGNVLKIGAMQHGEFMDVALGKDHTMEIFAHIPLGQESMVYDVEIKRLGERSSLQHHVSLAYLSVLIRDLILGRF